VVGRPFVKRFALCYRTVVLSCSVCLSCLSVLSVTLLCCGQTVGRIKMKLVMQVGSSLATLCMGSQLSLPKGAQPPIFGPYLPWPSGRMDQDATWYGGRSRPKRHCVRWGPSSPSPKRGHSPQFSAHVCCGQTAGWIKMPLGMKVDLGPGHCVTWGPISTPTGHSPQFLAHVHCGYSVAHLSYC